MWKEDKLIKMITKDNIRRWFSEANTDRQSHMMIIHDKHSDAYYPMYISKDDDAATVIEAHNSITEFSTISEVYNLCMSLEEQINQPRAWNI